MLATNEETYYMNVDVDLDDIFYDEDSDDLDGNGWCFAPADSTICWRFETPGEAGSFASQWVSDRVVER